MYIEPNQPDTLKTKQHFEILDGLRGIAALAIVIFHFMEWIYADFSENFIAHGFLAVDFFFCLSGFVIGYAYDNRSEEHTSELQSLMRISYAVFCLKTIIKRI